MAEPLNFEYEPETKKARASVAYTKRVVRSWMRFHLDEHVDPKTGEVNFTTLAEAAASHYGVSDLHGPLDTPEHWIWDLAVEVSDS